MKKILKILNLFHPIGISVMAFVFIGFWSEAQGQEYAGRIMYKEAIVKDTRFLDTGKFSFRLPNIATIKINDEKLLVLSDQKEGSIKGKIIDRSNLTTEYRFSLNIRCYNLKLVKVGTEIALVSRDGFEAFNVYYLKVSNSQVVLNRSARIKVEIPLHEPVLYYDFAVASVNNQLYVALIDPIPFKATYSGKYPSPSELSDCHFILYWLVVKKQSFIVANSLYVTDQPLAGGAINAVVNENGNYIFLFENKIISYDIKSRKWKQFRDIQKSREYFSANSNGEKAVLVSVDSNTDRMFFELLDMNSLKVLKSFFLDLNGKGIYNIESQIDSDWCIVSYITCDSEYINYASPHASSVPIYRVNNMIYQQIPVSSSHLSDVIVLF